MEKILKVTTEKRRAKKESKFIFFVFVSFETKYN